MTHATFYWHDYETWGANPAIDRPCQFAGLRTDMELNPIAEPDMWFCQPTPDVLPHPEAILVTGITPQQAQAQGLPEPEFAQKVHEVLSAAATCAVGYNSIRFDDEVSRYTFYRNFFDPYAREWQQGNSRWDIIDMVRTCYALKPETLQWPEIDGRVSFKLEALSAANHLLHARAHDALSDVEATIALAKLIKLKQPQLFEHLFRLRLKNNVAQEIDINQRKPFLHISSKFSAQNGCAALVVPLALHPKNKNAVIVFDLSQDPRDLISLSAEQIAQRVFSSAAELPEGEERISLKAVHLNKSPVVLTPKLLTSDNAQRLNIDKALCEAHWRTILQHDLGDKVARAFALAEFAPRTDPEQQLYEGFLPSADKPLLEKVRRAPAESLMNGDFQFNDSRYNGLLLRYKGRFFTDSLSPDERAQWQEICHRRWYDGVEGYLSVEQFGARVQALIEGGLTEQQVDNLKQAQQWLELSI
ncbi:MAG TPA: exodeoxyribonuclease I [Marinagarivorans sp.]